MHKTVCKSLLLPLFASLSFSISAAPAAQPTMSTMAATPSAVMQDASAPQVDVNKADAATLQSELTGIGKSKAEAIVAYREAHGPFTSVDELLEVKGIGSALLERNRSKLTVE
ncbi:helix-hairpin-helix domain-containing protein [Pseudomonas entomophila]|uniref:ComEA family DNA-binding protein n=1 Tax=Pseudomonas entomophila TaxID=312306 RepID=UPI0015E2AA79|nr:ComEA family DNA-binding protein [Pseudomonas entomophila]MBA1191004.1 helix-hairpin-helix domain-containing protein [Pseudomonas entomophila]